MVKATTKQQRVKYICHYKETADGVQWDKDFPTKPEADHFAIGITLSGGIAIVIPEYEDDDLFIGTLPEGSDNDN